MLAFNLPLHEEVIYSFKGNENRVFLGGVLGIVNAA